MRKTTDDRAYWLERAKGIRDIAEQTSCLTMREILEHLAQGYEEIAKRIATGERLI